jgi:hypothetical protein
MKPTTVEEADMRDTRPLTGLQMLTIIGLLAMTVATVWKIVWLGGLYIPAAWISGVFRPCWPFSLWPRALRGFS